MQQNDCLVRGGFGPVSQVRGLPHPNIATFDVLGLALRRGGSVEMRLKTFHSNRVESVQRTCITSSSRTTWPLSQAPALSHPR